MRHPEPVVRISPLWRSSEAGKLSVGNAGVANGVGASRVGATGFRACFIPIDRPSIRARIRVGAAHGHPSVGWLDGVGVPVEPFGVGARIGGVDHNDFAPARGDGESPHRPKRVEFGTRQSRWRGLGGRPCAERLGKAGDAERARPCVRTNVTGTSGASYKARFLRRHPPECISAASRRPELAPRRDPAFRARRRQRGGHVSRRLEANDVDFATCTNGDTR
jgi:hypothetical protein